MAKIQDMSVALLQLLRAAWAKNGRHMADADRPPEVLEFLLFQDGGDSQWYEIPGHLAWIYVRNVVPGLSADFHALNLEGEQAFNVEKVRGVVREIMREYDLRRLTMVLPAPVTNVAGAAARLGFQIEGRLVDACIYDGQFADGLVMGFYRGNVEKVALSPAAQAAPKRRRRRRSRRRKQVNAQGLQQAGSSPADARASDGNGVPQEVPPRVEVPAETGFRRNDPRAKGGKDPRQRDFRGRARRDTFPRSGTERSVH